MKFRLFGRVANFTRADAGVYVRLNQQDTHTNRNMLRDSEQLGRVEVFIPSSLNVDQLLVKPDLLRIDGTAIVADARWQPPQEGRKVKVISNYRFRAEAVIVAPANEAGPEINSPTPNEREPAGNL